MDNQDSSVEIGELEIELKELATPEEIREFEDRVEDEIKMYQQIRAETLVESYTIVLA